MASAFIAGTTIFIGDLTVNTGLQVNSSYNSTFNKMTNLLQTANETSSQFTQSAISTTSINPLQFSSWPILQITYQSYSIIYDIMTNMTNSLQLPEWIGTLIMTLIVFGLIFAIMSAIFFGRQV